MLKDLIVNLSTDVADDATVDYAVSLARAFDAHLAAVAFAYETVPIAMLAEDAPSDWIDELQKEAEEAAKAAVAKLEEAARNSGVSVEARWMTASFAGTAELFGRIARRFDLSVVRQAEPARVQVASA